MNVFSQFQSANNLNTKQSKTVINSAFKELINKYKQFELIHDETGVYITNYSYCSEEETGGWDKEEIENNLTDELIGIANRNI